MIQDELVDGAEWGRGRKRVDLVVIYYDLVEEEEWVCGDTSRRCGHYRGGCGRGGGALVG